MKNFLVIFICFLSLQIVWCAENCTQKLENMDNAVKKALMFTNPEARPYTSELDFNTSFCAPYKGWVKAINEYRSCLKNFQKTVFGIIVGNMKKNGRTFCDGSEKRRQVYPHTNCFTPEVRPDGLKAINKLTLVVEFVADQPNIDDMIPGLCCSFLRLMEELEKDMGLKCDPITKLETGKFIRKLVESNIADAIDLMCGNFGTIEKCQEKVPNLLNSINLKMAENEPIYNHTAFTSLLRFIQRMDSQVNL